MVVILLADGFEETEAVVPFDFMRRAGIDARFAGVGKKTVEGSHGIRIEADMELEELSAQCLEMLVLPGGLRGVENLQKSERVLALVREAWAADKWLAAICAAPTILAKLSITDGKKTTCYPGMEAQMPGTLSCSLAAVTDGRLITGRAAGSSMAFALELIKALKGDATAKKVAAGVVCNEF